MKLAIMQPYLFPYIGYFQLINAVDKFVIYDDVNFIKQGWINRNNILVQGQPLLFTIPLKKQSSFTLINEVLINDKLYKSWCKKYLRTVEQAYSKAPFFQNVFNLIEKVFELNTNNLSISELAVKSLTESCKYLGLESKFVLTSTIYKNSNLPGKERIIDICKKESVSYYINPIGGQKLYNKAYFKKKAIELSFIKSESIEYPQFKNEFVPWLSIIDVLMFNSIDETKLLLSKYELV